MERYVAVVVFLLFCFAVSLSWRGVALLYFALLCFDGWLTFVLLRRGWEGWEVVEVVVRGRGRGRWGIGSR